MKFNPATEKYVSLATFRKDGREVRTPVWLVGEGSEYYVFSESKAGKVKRIRNNGEVSIAPCDLRGNLKSEDWESGSAEIIGDSAKLNDIYAQFDSKYGWQMRLLNFIARLNGRYHKRAVLALKLEQN
ncbi:MAG: PPOX class probable F420-dependent enzyme [Candidatus Azotimanducaceae bacterium]|jgi:PPOX class probable F420-dependent enzyme